MTKTHEIKLDGYGAHTTLAEDRPIMLLGTAESYGIETLHVVSGKSWEGLTVTATFNAPDGTSTDMLMDADGSITVPSEATAKSGSGKIVFTGVSEGVQRISCDLEYFVVAHSAINGAQSGGTAPSWFEQAATRFMPPGGTAGQVLTKLTNTDFDAGWQNSQGGAGISGLTVETITVDDSSGDVPVEAISLDYSSLSLVVGETTQLAASVTPSNATNTAITWETSDSTIATVNAGLVTAVAPGDCTITAKSVENSAIMATCTVVVTAAGSGGTAGEKVQFTTLPYIAGTLKKKDGTTTNIAYGNYVEIPYTDGMKVSTGMNSGWVGNYPPFAVQDGDTYTVVEHDVGDVYNLAGVLVGKLYTTTLSGYSENAKVFVNFYANTENADQFAAMDELDGFWYIPGGEA